MVLPFSDVFHKSVKRTDVIVASAFIILLLSQSVLLTNAQTYTSISLSPYSGPQGSLINISGNGFTAYDKVSIYFGKTEVGGAAVGYDGTFTATITVPLLILRLGFIPYPQAIPRD